VLSWDFVRPEFKVGAKAGYTHSTLEYDYSRNLGNGQYARMARARNYLNTVYGLIDVDYAIDNRWLFTGSVTINQHFLHTGSLETDAEVSRMDFSAALSAKWRPVERLGLAVQLRSELSGREWAPVVPALLSDYLLSRRGNVILKASVSQNYRFPTLNDLFFEPGGNPNLKKESGFSYDAGVEFTVGKAGLWSLHGEATWFDSRVRDWIIWLPAIEGGSSTLVYKPDNIGRVHNYGVEFQASLGVKLADELVLDISGSFSWTPSINEGAPRGEYDRSVGKQLVYIPEYSSSVAGRLAWRTWSFDYKWCWYSERYATSDNMKGNRLTRIPPYYMSDIALEKRFEMRWAELSLKGAVKNLFDEEYESVLGRPMPGINFEIFIGIKPKWGK
jgi:iron complex outermembrane receptor protein